MLGRVFFSSVIICMELWAVDEMAKVELDDAVALSEDVQC
jgi:hypothetical protein